MENYRRLLPRYDRKHDIPGTLFGTTTIRQGMTATITSQMAAAVGADAGSIRHKETIMMRRS